MKEVVCGMLAVFPYDVMDMVSFYLFYPATTCQHTIFMAVTDVLRAEPVRARSGGEGTSPAGRLTTKSVARWPEPRLVQVRRKTDTSPSRVRESERQDENETGTESGTERTEAQDEVEEE